MDNNHKRNNNYKNNYSQIGFQLKKLDINDGDILLIECSNDRLPTSELKQISNYIKNRVDKDINIIIAPKEVSIRTVEEDYLSSIIDKLTEIRDNKWNNKLKGE